MRGPGSAQRGRKGRPRDTAGHAVGRKHQMKRVTHVVRPAAPRRPPHSPVVSRGVPRRPWRFHQTDSTVWGFCTTSVSRTAELPNCSTPSPNGYTHTPRSPRPPLPRGQPRAVCVWGALHTPRVGPGDPSARPRRARGRGSSASPSGRSFGVVTLMAADYAARRLDAVEAACQVGAVRLRLRFAC